MENLKNNNEECCKSCSSFKPFEWTKEKGFCTFNARIKKLIVPSIQKACKHFDKAVIVIIACLSLCSCSRQGLASFYEETGLKTASGASYAGSGMTAASWFYDLGTKVEVTELSTGRKVIVEINDRGPHKKLVAKGRIIDLSREAFEKLTGNLGKGLTKVKVRKL